MEAFNIKWDIDKDINDILLPSKIKIPDDITDEDNISNYLSDLTGFCHLGFELRK